MILLIVYHALELHKECQNTFIQILDIKANKRRLQIWLGHVRHVGEMENAYEIVP
jgi:hypothetical protein